jgi:thiol:disulfide interchange protein/DsbC/DsbD-like thiol-disulfide interchange protein
MKVNQIFAPIYSYGRLFFARAVVLTLGTVLIWSALAAGPSLSPSSDHVQVELISPVESVAPGKKLWIGLRMRHDPHWHTYWKNPGDSGLPTQLELTLPGSVTIGPLHWPKPERVFIPPLANYGYEGEVLLSKELEIPANFSGDQLAIRGKASWLVCKDVCIPGDAEVSLTLPVKTGNPAASAHQALFEKNWAREPKAELSVVAFATGEKLSLVLPATIKDAKRVEFFATSEETISHPAAQGLFKLNDGRYRLELVLANDKKIEFSKTPERAGGVLDIDGRFFVVNPTSVASTNMGAIEAGVLVATLAGAPTRTSADRPSPAEALRLATNSPSADVPASSVPATPANQSASASQAASDRVGASAGLWLSLGGALLGGLILNLMPCVFPVIGLKLMSFAGQGGEDRALVAEQRKRLRVETLAFSSGVILSFLLLGGLMLFLRSAGQAVGWGFQLQSPVFVGAMVLLFVALGLNFSGLFEVGLGLTQLGNFDLPRQNQSASNLAQSGQSSSNTGSARLSGTHPGQSLLSGVLAVLVATPCTAPFMGSALGFSLAQPALEALLVFAFLGLGMALPYLILAAWPGWLKYLPRPGRWMENFKQFLAFPMFAAAVWLLWVFGLQTSPEALMRLALAALSLAFSLWLYGRFFQGHARLRITSSAGIVVLALMLAGAAAAFTELVHSAQSDAAESKLPATAIWQPWSAQAVREGINQGRPVFVDFTAAWCVSCQANKKLVLETDTVSKAFADSKVLRLKADWTKQDPLITAELNRHGRNGVPLYLLYLPGRREAKILSELLTQGEVLSALGRTAR